MKKIWLLTLLLSACGGTDTGNALTSEIIVGTSNEDAPATELTTTSQDLSSINLDAAASQPLADITLSKAQVYVRQVAAPRQAGCSDKVPARKDWVASLDAFFIDWLGDAESNVDLSFDKNFKTCQIRLLAAASETTPSLNIEGTTATGTAFAITSNLTHLFVLRTAKPTNLQDDDSNLELVFYLKDAFTGAQIDALALGSTHLAISPATHPLLFAGFLKNMRKNLRAHPFKKVNGQVEKHRETVLGAGDDTADSPEDDELANGT